MTNTVEAFETPSNLDTDEFKEYQKRIEALLTDRMSATFPDGRPKGTTVSEIHQSLDSYHLQHWTLDAIEMCDGVLQEGYPTRYRLKPVNPEPPQSRYGNYPYNKKNKEKK